LVVSITTRPIGNPNDLTPGSTSPDEAVVDDVVTPTTPL
jgi:hypothetical protein